MECLHRDKLVRSCSPFGQLPCSSIVGLRPLVTFVAALLRYLALQRGSLLERWRQASAIEEERRTASTASLKAELTEKKEKAGGH